MNTQLKLVIGVLFLAVVLMRGCGCGCEAYSTDDDVPDEPKSKRSKKKNKKTKPSATKTPKYTITQAPGMGWHGGWTNRPTQAARFGQANRVAMPGRVVGVGGRWGEMLKAYGTFAQTQGPRVKYTQGPTYWNDPAWRAANSGYVNELARIASSPK